MRRGEGVGEAKASVARDLFAKSRNEASTASPDVLLDLKGVKGYRRRRTQLVVAPASVCGMQRATLWYQPIEMGLYGYSLFHEGEESKERTKPHRKPGRLLETYLCLPLGDARRIDESRCE